MALAMGRDLPVLEPTLVLQGKGQECRVSRRRNLTLSPECSTRIEICYCSLSPHGRGLGSGDVPEETHLGFPFLQLACDMAPSGAALPIQLAVRAPNKTSRTSLITDSRLFSSRPKMFTISFCSFFSEIGIGYVLR